MEEKHKENKEEPKTKGKPKSLGKKIWHFLWEEESILSYAVFIILAFVILRFVAFPAFLYVSGYSDIAAVVSNSMVHNDLTEYTYYEWLEFNGFNRTQVDQWPFQEGLNVGDVILVKKVPAEEIMPGDIILFYSPNGQIIHRVMYVASSNGNYYFTTKGDANTISSNMETDIPYDQVKGKLINKLPYLGYPKVAVSYIMPF